jgi:hypothetical protein
MDPTIALIAIVGIVFLVYSSGALSGLTGAPAPTTAPAPTSNAAAPPSGLQSNVSVTAPIITTPPGQTTQVNLTGAIVSGAASVGSAAAAAPASFSALGLTGAAAGAAVAGIGVIATIGAAMLAAHEQRKKQATTENAAVNQGVQEFDVNMKQINAAYNSRQIDAQSAISLLQTALSYYWQLVTPVIQPGRNGCQGGAVCSGLTCGGDVGAACCVGCGNLAGNNGTPSPFVGEAPGSTPVYWGAQGTIAVLQNGGGQVYYPTVFASSYGGQTRTGYYLTWQQAATA